MHDYAIIDHNRANIGRWLGLCAIAMASILSIILELLNSIPIFKDIPIFNNMFSFSISTGVLYYLSYRLFNTCIWNCKFLQLPDIQGCWVLEGETINQKKSEVDPFWEGKLMIEQTWDKIGISLQTNQSRSESYIATFKKERGENCWTLFYSYRNKPNVKQQHQLSSHVGFCEILFDMNKKTAQGSYFNDGVRYTFGKINLIRENDNDRFQ